MTFLSTIHLTIRIMCNPTLPAIGVRRLFKKNTSTRMAFTVVTHGDRVCLLSLPITALVGSVLWWSILSRHTKTLQPSTAVAKTRVPVVKATAEKHPGLNYCQILSPHDEEFSPEQIFKLKHRKCCLDHVSSYKISFCLIVARPRRRVDEMSWRRIDDTSRRRKWNIVECHELNRTTNDFIHKRRIVLAQISNKR